MKEHLNLGYLFSVVFLIFYQIFSSIVFLLPPLLGVFFVFLIIHFKKNGFDKTSLFTMLYLCFIEITHGLFSFSTITAFLIFFYYIYDRLIYKLKNREILIIIYIIFIYVFIIILNFIFAYVFELDRIGFDNIYIYYICLESLLSIAFFRKIV